MTTGEGQGGGAALPLLPTREIVLFPRMVASLFVGREKSVSAIETAFARTAIPAVYSKTTADNVGAHRITTRCGMTAIGPASAPDDRGGMIHGIEWRITRQEAARRKADRGAARVTGPEIG